MIKQADTKQSNTRKYVLSGAMFALYMFAFLLTEFTINEKAADLWGTKYVDFIYSVGIMCTGLGYLLFAGIFKILRTVRLVGQNVAMVDGADKVISCADRCAGPDVAGSCVAESGGLRGMKIMVIMQTAGFSVAIVLMEILTGAGTIAFGLMALLVFGSVGGLVHYILAVNVSVNGKGFTGRIVGLGAAAAALVQYVIQNYFLTGLSFAVSVISAAVLIAALARYFGSCGVASCGENFAAKQEDARKDTPVCVGATESDFARRGAETDSDHRFGENRRNFGILIAAVAVMSVISALADGIVTYFHAEGMANIASEERLCLVVGLLVAGFLADIKERSYLVIGTVAMMFLSVISAAFLVSPSLYWINIAIMYFYSGFYVVFLTAVFLDAAAKSNAPALWAGMGRIVRCFTIAVFALPSLWIFETFGETVIIIVSCVLSVLILLIFVFSGTLIPQKTEDIETAKIAIADPERFSLEYGLTKREQEVLAKVVSTDQNLQSIADELFISRRVLQRHLSSIYEKTGVDGRVGLVKKFFER